MVGYKVDLMIFVNMFFFRVLVMNPCGRNRRNNTKKNAFKLPKHYIAALRNWSIDG